MKHSWRERIDMWLIALGVFGALIAVTLGVYSATTFDRLTLAAILGGVAALIAGLMSMTVSHRSAKEREQQRIFIIYAQEDLDAARQLTAELKEHGLNAWLDVDEIVPGEVWPKAVIRALESSTLALVLISKHLSRKGFVQEELKTALDTLQAPRKGMSPIIPLRLDDSEVPESLSHVLAVDLYKEGGTERLLSGLAKMTSAAGKDARIQKEDVAR